MTFALLRRYDAQQWWMQPGPAHFSKAMCEPVSYQRAEVSDPTTTTQSKWVDVTVARMCELAKLELDWDGRGSAEVSIDALAFALSILGEVMPATAPPPAIVPLGHGGIQLLWHNAIADLEVEIVRPNEVIAYFLDKKTGHENEIQLTTDFSDITNFLWANFRS